MSEIKERLISDIVSVAKHRPIKLELDDHSSAKVVVEFKNGIKMELDTTSYADAKVVYRVFQAYMSERPERIPNVRGVTLL